MTFVGAAEDRRIVEAAIDEYEAVHWPPRRAAWLARWSVGRCMACGRRGTPMWDPTLGSWGNWRARRGTRRLEVHHLRYPTAFVGWPPGHQQAMPVRGAGEDDRDLIELCATTTGTGGKGCHGSGLLRGHTRWTPRLAELTALHVRRKRRRYWWRDIPTPPWVST